MVRTTCYCEKCHDDKPVESMGIRGNETIYFMTCGHRHTILTTEILQTAESYRKYRTYR